MRGSCFNRFNERGSRDKDGSFFRMKGWDAHLIHLSLFASSLISISFDTFGFLVLTIRRAYGRSRLHSREYELQRSVHPTRGRIPVEIKHQQCWFLSYGNGGMHATLSGGLASPTPAVTFVASVESGASENINIYM